MTNIINAQYRFLSEDDLVMLHNEISAKYELVELVRGDKVDDSEKNELTKDLVTVMVDTMEEIQRRKLEYTVDSYGNIVLKKWIMEGGFPWIPA